MTVNFTKNYQFSTRLSLEGSNLEEVNEVKLLGVILSNNLKWHSNTQAIVKNACKRMLILHNLSKFALPAEEMILIYTLYIRSVVENCAVVWHSSLSRGEEQEIERIQKCALRLILCEDYDNYENALTSSNLETLKDRRKHLCKNFAKKCIKSGKNAELFPLNPNSVNSRNHEKYLVTRASTSRLAKSAVPYMQRLLNEEMRPIS